MKKKIRNASAATLIAVVMVTGMNFTIGGSNFFEISKNLDIFTSMYKELNTYYVDEVEPAKLIKTGIDAMLKSLDPYTNYISEADIEGYKIQTTGKYGGIGAAIRKVGDYVIISEPYEGFPAFKSGLRAGDQIYEIEGKSAKGKTSDQVTKFLRGQPGTKVKIKVMKVGDSKPTPLTLTREQVKIKSVPYAGLVDDKVGYVKLSSFTAKCSNEVAAAVKALQEEHEIESLVFDLRGNGGGLLDEAVNTSNLFIPKDEIVVKTQGKIDEWDKTYKTKGGPLFEDIPLVVLTDKRSASASEIVSGVIQDYDRGVIMGQRTFGKGLVQTTKNIGYNSKLKLTTAKYYIPSGRCIQSINYADKDKDGSVAKIPDSLRNLFYTANKRPVYDGGGILPDMEMKARQNSKATNALITSQTLFKYVTDYTQKHSEIASAGEFKLTDAEYTEFVKWASGQDYAYNTSTEKYLKKTREYAEKENYIDAIASELDLLEKKLEADKETDLVKHKKEIKAYLEQEIAARYYFRKGRIQNTLDNDPEIEAAVKLLNDKAKYDGILKGKG